MLVCLTCIMNLVLVISNMVLSDKVYVELGKEKYFTMNLDKSCYESAVCNINGSYCIEKWKTKGPQYIPFNKDECEYYTDKNNRFDARRVFLIIFILNNVIPLLMFISCIDKIAFSMGIINILLITTSCGFSIYSVFDFEQKMINELCKICNIVLIPSNLVNIACIIIRMIFN